MSNVKKKITYTLKRKRGFKLYNPLLIFSAPTETPIVRVHHSDLNVSASDLKGTHLALSQAIITWSKVSSNSEEQSAIDPWESSQKWLSLDE